jgi:hypothetical protein
MMPRFDIKFPYGLGGLPVTEASLKTSLGRDVILLLGERDTDPNDPELRNTRQAEAQGPHRFARGQEFFREAKHESAELKAPFGWRLQIVPGAAHDPKKMSGPAAAVLVSGKWPGKGPHKQDNAK